MARQAEAENQAGAVELRRDERGLALVGDGMELRGDFSRMLSRLRHDRLGRELLVKAARVRGVDEPTAVDCTAGLGEDSLLLAAAGFRVTLFERDRTILALLSDALERVAKKGQNRPVPLKERHAEARRREQKRVLAKARRAVDGRGLIDAAHAGSLNEQLATQPVMAQARQHAGEIAAQLHAVAHERKPALVSAQLHGARLVFRLRLTRHGASRAGSSRRPRGRSRGTG